VRLEVPGMTGGVFWQPEFLPDGETFVFAWNRRDEEETGIYLSSLKGGQVKPPVLLRKGMTAAHYTELNGGELLFVESDNLYAQHLATGEPARLTGEPRKVLEGVYSTARLRQGFFTLSRNGVLVWTAGRAAKAQLTWFDRRGKALATAGPTCDAGSLSLAPDGRHILLTPMIGFSRIVETGREGYFPLPGVVGALWNPDGTRVTYIERGEHESRLMERAIGSGEVKELASYEGTVALKDLSPDGKVLLYTVNRALYARRIDASSRHAAPQQVTKVVAATVARFAPDGKRIAYTELSDRPRIYVQPFPSGGPRTEITTEGGNDPVWRRDGKEILYRWKGTIFSVRVDTRAGVFRAGQPEALFQVRTPPVVGTSQILDISRDGSRILFAQSMEASYPPPVYVMISWNDSGR
jgi:roadblock/LC7 domain-containing protein